MKIFCTHHKDAIERKAKLIDDFVFHGLNVEWIETFHPNDFRVEDLDIRHKLNKAAISLYLKHRQCFELQKENQYDYMLIFEDDILIPRDLDIKRYIERAVTEFNSINGDILNIGTAFNLRPSIITKNKMVYWEPHFNTRCTHAILYPLKTVERILHHLYIIDDAIDWKLNHIIKKENLKSCYVEPGLFQSSQQHQIDSLIQ